jgi:hypothetical protein
MAVRRQQGVPLAEPTVELVVYIAALMAELAVVAASIAAAAAVPTSHMPLVATAASVSEEMEEDLPVQPEVAVDIMVAVVPQEEQTPTQEAVAVLHGQVH